MMADRVEVKAGDCWAVRGGDVRWVVSVHPHPQHPEFKMAMYRLHSPEITQLRLSEFEAWIAESGAEWHAI